MQKKAIIFVIPSLATGGAERVMMNIITNLDASRYDISLVLFEKRGTNLDRIPDHVKLYNLDKKNRFGFFKLILRLSCLFSRIKPDVVFCFIDYANIISISSRFLSCRKFKLIVSIRSYWLKYLNDSQRYSAIKYLLYKWLYGYADLIVFNSAESGEHFKLEVNIADDKIRVVPNLIDLKAIDLLKNEDIYDEKIKSSKYILGAGRLSMEKGFDYLLKAYASISSAVEEKLLIIGDGEEEEQRLRSLSEELGIAAKTVFIASQNNPYKYMHNASIFVLSSLWEGFPNVLIEAMACGAPAVSTDCTSGPREIIENYKNGLLVPVADEKALGEAMLSLLQNGSLRKKISDEGRKTAEGFSVEKVLPLYEGLFQGKDK